MVPEAIRKKLEPMDNLAKDYRQHSQKTRLEATFNALITFTAPAAAL